MTELARVLPKSILSAIDRYRALHGIRSRKTALEQMVQQVAPSHPLEQALQAAEKLPKGSVSGRAIAQFQESKRLQASGKEEFVTLQHYLEHRKD
jgi:hypothetical protein